METFPKNKELTRQELLDFCNRGTVHKITREMIRGWTQSRLLRPRENKTSGEFLFSFLDVIKAKTLSTLLDAKRRNGNGKERTDKKTRAAIARLEKIFKTAAGPGDKFSSITIYTESIKIIFEAGSYKIGGATNQLLLRFGNQTSGMADEEGLVWLAENPR